MRRAITTALGGCVPLAALMLAGCTTEPDEPEPEATPTENPRSIFQDPEALEGSVAPPATLPPLETTLAFPDGTAELTEAVRAELATVVDSPQIEAGGPITLRGHSDSDGGDEDNLELSRSFAEAVRDYLIENDIEEERIRVIAFGEQNPAEPNALPDGSPNIEGRAANRRVELVVATGSSGEREQTLIETISSPEPGASPMPQARSSATPRRQPAQ